MTYGKSITLSDSFDFAFDPDSKGLTFISSTDNLVQDLKIILNTFQGENKFVPNFGTRLQDLVGRKVSPNFVKYTVKSALLKDSRVASVDKIYVKHSGINTLKLRIVITTVDEDTVELTGELT